MQILCDMCTCPCGRLFDYGAPQPGRPPTVRGHAAAMRRTRRGHKGRSALAPCDRVVFPSSLSCRKRFCASPAAHFGPMDRTRGEASLRPLLATAAGGRGSMVAASVQDAQPSDAVSQLYAVLDGSRMAAAGGLAGVVARTATAPLDRVKLLFQVQVRAAAFRLRLLGSRLSTEKLQPTRWRVSPRLHRLSQPTCQQIPTRAFGRHSPRRGAALASCPPFQAFTGTPPQTLLSTLFPHRYASPLGPSVPHTYPHAHPCPRPRRSTGKRASSPSGRGTA